MFSWGNEPGYFRLLEVTGIVFKGFLKNCGITGDFFFPCHFSWTWLKLYVFSAVFYPANGEFWRVASSLHLRQRSVLLHVVYLFCFLSFPRETKAFPKSFREKPDLGQILMFEFRFCSRVKVDGVLSSILCLSLSGLAHRIWICMWQTASRLRNKTASVSFVNSPKVFLW